MTNPINQSEGIEQLLSEARGAMGSSSANLQVNLQKVGVVPAYPGEPVQANLMYAIDLHVRAAARVAVLEAMSASDFYVAVMASAGKLKE